MTSRRAKPKVLVADQIAAEGVEMLTQSGIDAVVKTGLDNKELAKQLRKVDGVIVRSATKIRADVLSAKSTVKVIGRAGIGVDNIDLPAATELGVVVLNTPDANAATTAELAIAHIFSLARKLTFADASVRQGKWERGSFSGTEIAGKTVGIVGYGTIGRIVAARCRGLELRVLVHDPFVKTQVVEDDGCEVATLAQLLKQADFVTIHAPGTRDTMDLIGPAELKRMKRSAYLIQCARGGIVNEQALAQALNAGRIAGAAVDVYTTEPLPADHVLRDVDNIVYTPHLGASTAEAQKATGTEIARQLATFFATGEAVNAVNLPRIPADQLDAARPYLPLARNLGTLLGALGSSQPDSLEIVLHGQAAEISEGVIAAEILAGLLGPTLSVPVNQVNAQSLAERQGLTVSLTRKTTAAEFATMIELITRSGRRQHMVAGTLLGGAQPRLAYFEGIELEAPLSGSLLVTTHKDRPGVIAKITALLAEERINISHMHVGVHSAGGNAAACLRLGRQPSAATLKRIRAMAAVTSAIHLEL